MSFQSLDDLIRKRRDKLVYLRLRENFREYIKNSGAKYKPVPDDTATASPMEQLSDALNVKPPVRKGTNRMPYDWGTGQDTGPLSPKPKVDLDPVARYRSLEVMRNPYTKLRPSETRAITVAFEQAEDHILKFATEATKASFRQGYIDFIERNNKTPYKKPAPSPPVEVDSNQLPILERIIAMGYRELAKKTHPDMQGGNRDKFEELKTAKTQLDGLVEELKRLL